MTGKIPYRLLLIDDDAALGELLVEYFARFGHRLAAATTAADGRYLLRRDNPDLLILDVMLPDADGMEVCREIRAISDIPIVMLTARGDLPDRVLGLELGADDYITKPFSIRELMARIKAIFRRLEADKAEHAESVDNQELVHGDLTIQVVKRKVLLSGRPIELTAKEFDLLVRFAANPVARPARMRPPSAGLLPSFFRSSGCIRRWSGEVLHP